ncbi:pyridoxal phosphate-dependent transferase [Thelonectria olida]|uniref:Pyridoxal phosphate-dependent transferase n=1 Tax=Thelonectria olida TaxID=1576542 RepID=A0A9P9AP04_9HYPO|nr:pyridoxal phosphate-dependent transferase [Thelonectria olida]
MSKPNNPINLIRGWPAPDLLPASLLSASAQRLLADPDVYVPALQYGPDPGYQPLREGLSTWLAAHYGVTADAERICITGGASQNIANILQSFTDPTVTKAVWMVAPTYHLACDIFADAGFAGRLRAFPEDEEGVDLEALEERIRQLEEDEEKKPQLKPFKNAGEFRKHYRHIIYVVPTCSNPSGKTMSVRRREGLVHLARKYDALVICDDVYDLLQWPTDKLADTPLRSNETPEMMLPRLCDIDLAMGQAEDDPKGFGYAVSNGSFSKMTGPGCRTGWLEGSRAFAFGLAQTGASKSGGAPSQLSAAILAGIVKSGELRDFLAERVRPGLQRRHKLMVDAIHEHLSPLGVTIREAGLVDGSVYGGYFIWANLPEGFSAKQIADVALAEEQLIVGNGNMFQVHGDEHTVDLDGAIRLTFAWVSEDDLVEGVRRLGGVMQRIKTDAAKYANFSGDVSDAALIGSSK